MFSFLSQPYPARDPRFSIAVLQALLSGVLIASVLVVFQPFGIYNWQHPNKTYLLAGYGLVAVVAYLTDFVIFQKIFCAYFTERNWLVWKEILRNMLGFVLAGFLCVVYGHMFGMMPFNLTQVITMIAVCFMVGALPTTILVLLNYSYLTHKYSQPIFTPREQLTPLSQEKDLLELIAENEKDRVAIPASALLFLVASDNYCTVIYEESDKICKVLLRSSLSRLERQIISPRIVRCHRSYLVNLDRVASVSGNAQGYKLHLNIDMEPVPVSRSFNWVVKEQIQVC